MARRRKDEEEPQVTLSVEDLAFSKLLCYAAAQNPNYKIGAMHETVAMYLEAVERGDITRLMIFAPPRHGKTNLVSEMFPAWIIGRNPHWHIISCSYSQTRANDVGRKVRNQVDDKLHQNIFPHCRIADDMKSIQHFSTMQGGEFYSMGVGGSLVGRGAECFLLDDPIKDRQTAESKLERKKIQDWYRGVAYTRLHKGGRVIVINTRWHEDDLSGWLLREHASEGWTVLNMPAIAEDNDILGRAPGEALWPEAFPKENLEKIKTAIGSYEWAAQYQQRPVGAEGSIVKHDWIQRYSPSNMPDFTKIVLSCDTAFKSTEISDPTAILVWGVTKANYYLLDVFCKRMEFPELKRVVARMCQTWGATACLVEDRSSGQSLIQEFKRISPIPVIPVKTNNIDKVTRFSSVSHYFESGTVMLPTHAAWLVDYENQITTFPYDKHDDMVDATSQFLIWGSKPRYSFSLKPLFWK